MLPPIVEVLYFEGCPNHHEARERVEVIAAREGLVELDLRQVAVTSTDEAERLRFLGSPSIRVDGRDVEQSADGRDTFALACRVYRTSSGPGGLPSEERVRAALHPS